MKMTHIGELIKKRVKEKGITLRSVATSFAPPLSEQFVTSLIKGIAPVPKARIKDLATILGVNTEVVAEAVIADFGKKLWSAIDASEARL